jgi:hypothetical protein
VLHGCHLARIGSPKTRFIMSSAANCSGVKFCSVGISVASHAVRCHGLITVLALLIADACMFCCCLCVQGPFSNQGKLLQQTSRCNRSQSRRVAGVPAATLSLGAEWGEKQPRLRGTQAGLLAEDGGLVCGGFGFLSVSCAHAEHLSSHSLTCFVLQRR